MRIDMNADMGEGYGIYKAGDDEGILPYLSSANIACGFHAGDPLTIVRTIRLAKKHGVAVGAHPGFPDRIGFGRREMAMSTDQLFADLVYQIGAVKAIANSEGVALQHVKPHGALYNMAVADIQIAQVIVQAIGAIDTGLILYTLPHGALLTAAEKSGIRVAREFFIDRTYGADGTLTPRSEPGSMITSAEEAGQRVVKLLREGAVTTTTGHTIPMEADTLCIHGDEPHAVSFARETYRLLRAEGIQVSAIGSK